MASKWILHFVQNDKTGGVGDPALQFRKKAAPFWARRLVGRNEFAAGLLRRGGEVGLGGVPVHDVPERGDIIRPAVLVVEIIGVLPDIEAEDGLALDAGDA